MQSVIGYDVHTHETKASYDTSSEALIEWKQLKFTGIYKYLSNISKRLKPYLQFNACFVR